MCGPNAADAAVAATISGKLPQISVPVNEEKTELELGDYELRLTPNDRRSALEVARRQGNRSERTKERGR